jgi:hypothetical protein
LINALFDSEKLFAADARRLPPGVSAQPLGGGRPTKLLPSPVELDEEMLREPDALEKDLDKCASGVSSKAAESRRSSRSSESVVAG